MSVISSKLECKPRVRMTCTDFLSRPKKLISVDSNKCSL